MSKTGTADFRTPKGRSVKSKSTTLDIVRADFSLFRGLLVRVPLDQIEKYPKPAGKQMSLLSLKKGKKEDLGNYRLHPHLHPWNGNS